jgi:AhpD family alkylhydroperoxidase
MEMARANGCHYCIPAHRHVARHNGVDTGMIERIALGETLDGNGREATIQRLAKRLQETRGMLSDREFSEFQRNGISIPEMIAVIAEIAHCTITNFTNRLAQTELDPFLEAYKDGPAE